MLNHHSLLALSLAVLALSSAGCGRDLLAVCEEAQTADCTKITDCQKAIDLGTDLAEKSGCQDALDSYTSCATDQEDVCTVDDACSKQSNAFGTCALPYCATHLEECAAFAEANGY